MTATVVNTFGRDDALITFRDNGEIKLAGCDDPVGVIVALMRMMHLERPPVCLDGDTWIVHWAYNGLNSASWSCLVQDVCADLRAYERSRQGKPR